MYLSRAKTVTVCSLSYSWWEGPDVPDVIRPELPAGRSGPVRAFTDVACRTRPDVRSGSGRTRPASGRSLVLIQHLLQCVTVLIKLKKILGQIFLRGCSLKGASLICGQVLEAVALAHFDCTSTSSCTRAFLAKSFPAKTAFYDVSRICVESVCVIHQFHSNVTSS